MKTEITIAWDGKDIIGRNSTGSVLARLVDQDPIDVSTDSWHVAGYMADAIGAELEAVDHDGKFIHATISR